MKELGASRRHFFCCAFCFATFPYSEVQANEAPLIGCYSDARSSLTAHFFGPDVDQKFLAAMKPALPALALHLMIRCEQRKVLPPQKFAGLKELVFELAEDANGLGFSKGKTVVIDQGHLMVGYILSYAKALVSTTAMSVDSLMTWSMVLASALIDGDPLPAPLGHNDFFNFITSPSRDTALAAAFHEHMSAFQSLTLLHEFVHIRDNHLQRFLHAFPHASSDYGTWTNRMFMMSQMLELEADEGAIELMVSGAGGTKTYGAVEDWLFWLHLRSWIMKKKSILRFATHPDVDRRSEEYLRNFFYECRQTTSGTSLTDHDEERFRELYEYRRSVVKNYVERIAIPTLDLNKLKLAVPSGTPVEFRRFFLRDCFLTDRNPCVVESWEQNGSPPYPGFSPPP